MKLAITAILLSFVSAANAQLIINTGEVVSETPRYAAVAPPKPKERPAEQPRTSRPIVIGNTPNFHCPGCEEAKKWKDMPFDIVWRVNMDIGKIAKNVSWPLFQFPKKDGNVSNLWLCSKKQLVSQWTLNASTDPQQYSDILSRLTGKKVPLPAFSAPKPTAGTEVVCGCGGKVSGCCICLKENQSGARAKPCTCSKDKGSIHLVGNDYLNTGKAYGATGEYSIFNPVSRTSTRTISSVPASDLPPEAQPTSMAEVHRVLRILNPKPTETFVDFGCGYDARFCIAAASVYGCKAIGVEIDPERAESSKRHVVSLGLSHLVTIIEGDATQVDVQADVGVAYLWPEVLTQLKPNLIKLTRFASVQHRVPGLAMSKNGDSYLWNKPRAVARTAVWGNRTYSRPVAIWNGAQYFGRVCQNPGCSMCSAIERQLRTRK